MESTRDWSSFRQWPTWLKVIVVLAAIWAVIVMVSVVGALING